MKKLLPLTDAGNLFGRIDKEFAQIAANIFNSRIFAIN